MSFELCVLFCLFYCNLESPRRFFSVWYVDRSTCSTIVHTLSFLFSTMPFSAFLPILGLVYFWLICSSYRFLKLILSLLYLCVCVSFQYVLKNRSSYFLSTQIHKHFLSCFALLVPVLRNVSLISDQIYLPIFSSKTLIFAFHICL